MARIYTKSTRELFGEFVASFVPPKDRGFFPRKSLADGGHFTRKEILAWFERNYPKIKRGTITAHLTIMSTNATGRVHHHLRPNGADDLLFQMSPKTFRLYDKTSDPAPIYAQGTTPQTDDEDEQEQE